ncbi:hypothetical protein PCASD_15740 [Puccinia coronata f. sp. avenae]|uniref:Uncharacterized protein n=1 Tax=Puccinia coronata f. sp. avenae TaxID=200324 RepID=A0A2N5U761_9BASI|nr:hypothetical protein PCASD_15740 [Puccinia coronata f. sp. avenae]
MRFAIVAASAVALGATVAEARAIAASSPRRHADNVMKRSNAHETRVEIERLNFATPSRLSKRSKLADDDRNDDTLSSPDQANIIAPFSHEATTKTHIRATESADHEHQKHKKHHHKQRVASSKNNYVDRTVTSNPSQALPNNVIWRIERNSDEDASKSGAPKFTLAPIVPIGTITKDRQAGIVPPTSEIEYMMVPVTSAKPAIDALPNPSPIEGLIEKENQRANDSASTSALLRAFETYQEAVTKQQTSASETNFKLESSKTSRASKKNSKKSANNTQKDDDNCDPEAEDACSDSLTAATDFRTVLTTGDQK